MGKRLESIESYDAAYLFDTELGDAFIVKVRGDGGDVYSAFSNVCTHMGCALIRTDGAPLTRSGGALLCGPCPCHGTTFDLTRRGIVVLGPATQHLPELELSIAGGEATATEWRGPPAPDGKVWP